MSSYFHFLFAIPYSYFVILLKKFPFIKLKIGSFVQLTAVFQRRSIKGRKANSFINETKDSPDKRKEASTQASTFTILIIS